MHVFNEVQFPCYQLLGLVDIYLKCSLKMLFLAFFYVKQIRRAHIIQTIVGDTFSLTAMVFVHHFENEIPLTINHGREMPVISGIVGNYY